jgi:hypothetical protein
MINILIARGHYWSEQNTEALSRGLEKYSIGEPKKIIIINHV